MAGRSTLAASVNHAGVRNADRVTVYGPASLSNLGPGFDTIGLCLEGPGDHIEGWLTDEPGIHIVRGDGPLDAGIPVVLERNTAAVAAQEVLRQAGYREGVVLKIRKGIPLGSGIGGSAASAVAGAWVANALIGYPFTKEELVRPVLAGEQVASGSLHGDNVLPALFGGLVLVSPSDPVHFRRIPVPDDLAIAVVQPSIQILTEEARSLLPEQVPFRDAVCNAAELSFMLDAFRAGDWEVVGRCMMGDRLVEPVRARLVPCYDAVRQAALDAGAFGCALTGSGPALFALAASHTMAQEVLRAMTAASRSQGLEATGWVTRIGSDGVRSLNG